MAAKAARPMARFARIGARMALSRALGGVAASPRASRWPGACWRTAAASRLGVAPDPRAPARSWLAESSCQLIRRELDALRHRDIATLRHRVDEMALPVLHRFGVRLVRARVGDLPGWRFDLADAAPPSSLGPKGDRMLYLHGGGYVYGSARSHGAFVAQLAAAARLPAVFPEYRLAPEHPFPAALEDALAAYEALLAEGQDPSRLVLAGESAGGGLCVALMIALRDQGLPPPARAVLISPWVDHTFSHPSVDENSPYDCADRPIAEQWSAAYRCGADPRDPRISPLFADLAGLPPIRLQFGSAEMLRDEDRDLADRLGRAGVDVRSSEWPGMFHVWQFAAPVLPEGRSAIAELGQLARGH